MNKEQLYDIPLSSASLLILNYSLNKRCFKILQQRMLRILFTQDSLIRWNPPVNTQAFIQDTDATVRFRMIEVVTFVLEDGRLAQYRESVGKSLWNEKLPVIIFCQFHSHMLSVGGASLADIHRYIQYRSLHAAHQFALGVGRALEMQPPHHPVGGHAFIVLYKLYLAYLLFKFPLRERFEEITSRVSENARFYDYHVLYCCFDDFHILV